MIQKNSSGKCIMDLCELCKERQPNIHFTQIVNGESTVQHLCEECARNKGISITINPELLSGNADESAIAPPVEKEIICPQCHLAYSEFRTKGWLGCVNCYAAFETQIGNLLTQVHGSSVHRGKQYRRAQEVLLKVAEDVGDLKTQLENAIAQENFELAVQLRDQVRLLCRKENSKQAESVQ